MNRRLVPLVGIAVLALALPSCAKKKILPDTLPGWHSADFQHLFGRLQRVVSTQPGADPIWVIRFGLANERYGGEFALLPPNKLASYTGGEQVQIIGHVRKELGFPNYPGTWYEIQSIRLWDNYR